MSSSWVQWFWVNDVGDVTWEEHAFVYQIKCMCLNRGSLSSGVLTEGSSGIMLCAVLLLFPCSWVRDRVRLVS